MPASSISWTDRDRQLLFDRVFAGEQTEGPTIKPRAAAGRMPRVPVASQSRRPQPLLVSRLPWAVSPS